jgi:F5/8 type C domain
LHFKTDFKKISKDRKIISLTEYANQYNGGLHEALIDMRQGGTDFRTSGWQGWQGKNMEMVLDLGKEETIEKLTLRCLQDQNSWIFMPKEVVFSFSEDNKTFYEMGKATNPIDPKHNGGIIHPFQIFSKPVKARYIKIKAINSGKVPDWHIGAGGESWIFADEIIVN